MSNLQTKLSNYISHIHLSLSWDHWVPIIISICGMRNNLQTKLIIYICVTVFVCLSNCTEWGNYSRLAAFLLPLINSAADCACGDQCWDLESIRAKTMSPLSLWQRLCSDSWMPASHRIIMKMDRTHRVDPGWE